MIVLWDLDGTLTDPQDGIIGCIQYALKETGRPVPEHTELLWTIGPPLEKSFAKLDPTASQEQIWEMITKYRERFAPTGIFENSLLFGIPDLLARVSKEYRCVLATSKPHVFATRIIEHFKLGSSIAKVYGSELDGTRNDKGELIQYVLQQEGVDAHEAVMIGDRLHDISGAKKNGVFAIGVLWGYGSREELEEAGADKIFESTVELREFLISEEVRSGRALQ
jgi:phosphoglycolate phosphatase